MRELLFRGYDGMDWVYGMTLTYERETDTYFMMQDDEEWVMVCNVGQYTGLMDDKGERIFEGDIVKVIDGKRENISEVYMHPYGVYINAHPFVKELTGREIEHLYNYCDYGDGRGISQRCVIVGDKFEKHI
ncbi:hypothetical protein ANABIO32_00820 [Rossellomorea marisflavi]|uniref:YopX family protein n=1 Tax=Rossellomorea marisflavi TaxID=189381 RepID=UPI0025C7AA6D|nr:YopX family protein [Rossellomorea marisflavi]GLI82396.1 hypothetical protein ANABIO32_00820 [Rossellomorea marisflavi]